MLHDIFLIFISWMGVQQHERDTSCIYIRDVFGQNTDFFHSNFMPMINQDYSNDKIHSDTE